MSAVLQVDCAAKLVTPMERKVFKILGRYGADGATIFEIRKALSGDVMAGTVRNCLVGLIRKGVVLQDTFTSDRDRMARDVDHCDVYRLKRDAA
ncbi:hypothetical protein [Zhongshania marina]|uniref:Transcriptional regulator n=1 Tax=Zhongshania marina TaxID=2304603 RepID=A0A2S4HGG1_9GAMM|nr:hypothetical protein [Marortus luteolus]POP53085.1 hypothetical protein C0068_08315 [Marortus luteolus]